MRMSMNMFVLSVLLGCASCGEDQPAPGPGPAKIADEPRDTELDAGPLDEDGGGPDVHLRLIALLLEIERLSLARCPCLREGDEKTTQTCIDQVTFKAGWQDCVATLPVPEDGAEFRERLGCSLAEVRRRNDCYSPAPCSENVLANCREESLTCEPLENELLARVVKHCPRWIALFP